jgi:hypothetical protein
MKTNQNVRSSKFLKTFEIGKSKQSDVLGGGPNDPGGSGPGGGGWITSYTIPGSEASSYACPDTKQDLFPN